MYLPTRAVTALELGYSISYCNGQLDAPRALIYFITGDTSPHLFRTNIFYNTPARIFPCAIVISSKELQVIKILFSLSFSHASQCKCHLSGFESGVYLHSKQEECSPWDGGNGGLHTASGGTMWSPGSASWRECCCMYIRPSLATYVVQITNKPLGCRSCCWYIFPTDRKYDFCPF